MGRPASPAVGLGVARRPWGAALHASWGAPSARGDLLHIVRSLPACIVVIDKEHANARKGVFLVDASRGFIDRASAFG